MQPHPTTDPVRRGRWPAGLWRNVALAILIYYLMLVVAAIGSESPLPLSLTFNSMLDHMLHGRADVDPAIVGEEGFLRGGQVYAYWGILPALLRLPMTLVPGWRGIDVTLTYSVIAIALMMAVKLWTLRLVLHSAIVPRPLGQAMAVVLVLSGAQVSFVHFSIYQEVCLWAGVCGALFVAAAVSASINGPRRAELLVMAASAGAAMLTRVSMGIGLVAAFGLLLAVLIVRERSDWRALARRALPALAVLALAGLITALVNDARWGNPLTFADYQYHKMNLRFPDRVARTAGHGLFSLDRIPFGLLYYFLPVWVLPSGDGLWLEAMRDRLIDAAELPPGSFLLTDPLLLLLGAVALIGWWRERRIDGPAIAAGLTIPPVLMLAAISMSFRYRIDFYPLIEFLAFSGLTVKSAAALSARPRLIRALVIVSVVCSLATAIFYLAGELGPGDKLIGNSLVDYYLARLHLR